MDEETTTTVLKQYLHNIKKIQLMASKLQLTEERINSVMEDKMQSLLIRQKKSNCGEKLPQQNLSPYFSTPLIFFKKALEILFIFILLILFLYLLLQHKPIQYFIQSKLQDFIYPGMKILRKLFLPLISAYPSLTNFYDESCLVVNPFFRVPDMPCPCEDVRAILNLTGEDTKREQYHSGVPFMVMSNRDGVSWENLKTLYHNHKSTFDRDTTHLVMSSPGNQAMWSTPASFFETVWSINDSSQAHTHTTWKCNRMEPTRLLRSTFGVPAGEPSYAAGVTIEKLVMIDGPRAPSYRMPTTDGTTVFLQQSSGSRMIVLTPANECKDKCTTVSVVLPPCHTLWFSWWYWRANSFPAPGTNSVSITYVGSYL